MASESSSSPATAEWHTWVSVMAVGLMGCGMVFLARGGIAEAPGMYQPGLPQAVAPIPEGEIAQQVASSGFAVVRTTAEPVAMAASVETASPEDLTQDAAFWALVNDRALVARGQMQYEMFCQACHYTPDTPGDSPSNIFDNKWYHGSSPTAIDRVIREGYIDAGMPGWEGMIEDPALDAILAYLLSFQEPPTG